MLFLKVSKYYDNKLILNQIIKENLLDKYNFIFELINFKIIIYN